MSYTLRVPRNRFDRFQDDELAALVIALWNAPGQVADRLRKEVAEVVNERREEDQWEIEHMMGAHHD